MSPAWTLKASVRGIGVLGPGLADWRTAAGVLREPARWVHAPTALKPPARLPPAERRRAGAGVKLSLAVADEACAHAGIDPRNLATVFTSSSSDPANCHALCEVLAGDRLVSPTRFTNSVHNAPAGYWHIATASRAPSTSLCAYDASFAAGLLEAVTQSNAWRRPVLLVATDVPNPEPLHSLRPLPDAFGVALLLDAAGGAEALACVALRAAGESAASRSLGNADLDRLCASVPAARGLPLLQAIAHGVHASFVLADPEGLSLAVDLEPAGRT